MNSVSRTWGRIVHRGPGDNARVSVLLKDYEDADKLLAKMADESRALRDAWHTMVMTQLGAATEYVTLYDPIVGATDGHGRPAEPTPETQLVRSFNLRKAYDELKDDMVAEIAAFDTHVIRPATDARESIQPLRKTIKKRENKRLDYEKCQDKVRKLQRKPGKSAKEDALMHKHEEELQRLAEEFQIADNHLRETLPPIIQAAFSLLPPLLTAIVAIQNRLLALSYTSIHTYCEENNFPSPSPPMEDVIAVWSEGFKPIQREVESAVSIIRQGKAIHLPMNMGDDYNRRPSVPSSASSVHSKNGVGRTSSGLIPGGAAGRDTGRDRSTSPMPPGLRRVPSYNSVSPGVASPYEPSPQPSPRSSNVSLAYGQGVATDFTWATQLSNSGAVRSPGPAQAADYFGHSTSRPSSNLAGVAAKKKPPPPPPKKNFGKQEEFVIAQYDFQGQGQGDLSFREGDTIKIIKKTDKYQDWWEGELNGVRGSFPANYCKPKAAR